MIPSRAIINILAVSAAVFLLALGENLWKRFLPKYLEALGAPVAAIGLFGSFQDLLDGVYQYPGGWIGDRYGRRRALLLFVALATIVGLAVLTLAAVRRVDIPVSVDVVPIHIVTVWRSLPTPLRWLLTSDIVIRTCEGLVDVFLVLYAINVIGLGAAAYGVLIGVQMTTAILSYLPVARLADRIGRKPFVIATFVAFAAFPVAVERGDH